MHVFLSIIAWVGVVISGLFFLVNLIAHFQYTGSMTEHYDRSRGVRKSYRKSVLQGFIVLVICIAYLIAFSDQNDTNEQPRKEQTEQS